MHNHAKAAHHKAQAIALTGAVLAGGPAHIPVTAVAVLTSSVAATKPALARWWCKIQCLWEAASTALAYQSNSQVWPARYGGPHCALDLTKCT